MLRRTIGGLILLVLRLHRMVTSRLRLGLSFSELSERPRSLRSSALWALPDRLLKRSCSFIFCTLCLLLQQPCANGVLQAPLPEEGVRHDCARSPVVAFRCSTPITTSSSVVLLASDLAASTSMPSSNRNDEVVLIEPLSSTPDVELSTTVHLRDPVEPSPR